MCCLQKWHGRSWSRFNLHNSIHHSRQLHLADLATSARQQSRGSVALPNRAPELGALPTNMQTQDLSTDTVTCGGHPTAAAAAANTGKSAITANGSDPNTDIAHGDEDSHSLSAAHPEAVHIPHACSQQAAASAPSNAAPVSADRAALQPAETQVPQPAGEGIPQSATRGFTQPGLRLANGNSASPQQGRHQQAAVGQTPAEGKGRVAVQSVSGKDLQIELLKPVAAWGDVDADLAKQAQMLNR